ncbi:peptidase inhibitor family I36 protein [Streptacidiphilus jiangxiensis]|uniref:peptidase inhibitor family I36 protein n=1 Tax=Streptacidiphilus jiangxiensis TaxID=235985 RepID=UPI0006942239|nr:peptidase inhibitor family I36 protein [Streptacidiphilus jiangxiensis]
MRTFAAQARQAGLTATQATALQRQVDAIIAKDGGQQVAANEISLPHGGAVLLALPGHRYARVIPGAVNLGFAVASPNDDRTAPMTHPVPAAGVTPNYTGSGSSNGGTWYWNGTSCFYQYICMWQGQNGTGTLFRVSQCNLDQELPGSGWNTGGSWLNNETPGTVAYFKNSGHGTIYTTPAPVFWNSDYNWQPVWYVNACA